MSRTNRQAGSPHLPPLALAVVGLVGLAIFAGAWGYFVVSFGWLVGGALGWWPATLMGGGAALLVAIALTILCRQPLVRVESEPPPAAAPEGREI
jgi:hypothetical protein